MTDSTDLKDAEQVPESLNTDADIVETEDFRLNDSEIPAAIESLLFAYGEAVTLDRLAGLLGIDRDRTIDIMNNLIIEYKNNARRGILIRQIEDTYILSTKPEMRNVIERIFLQKNRPQMTQASYETLAIIAYNQPVTRSQIEAVRGVSSDSIITRLQEKNLIHECGSLDAPGRPSLFETTNLFLREFGLSSVRDLPPMDMIMYKTLRDIESSVAEASAFKPDSQVTIEQLVSTAAAKYYGHVSNEVDVIPKLSDDGNEKGSTENNDKMDDESVIGISEAFFGEDKL